MTDRQSSSDRWYRISDEDLTRVLEIALDPTNPRIFMRPTDPEGSRDPRVRAALVKQIMLETGLMEVLS